ncbi:hypothetical protein GW17_00013747 [Ensete ventricosum]|nr:hypothetical protein GW17_00013747 [Ensete ventricosum]
MDRAGGEHYLVFCESHLDDPIGIMNRVERIIIVRLPAIEVGGVLTVAVTRSDPGEDLLVVNPHGQRNGESLEKEKKGEPVVVCWHIEDACKGDERI